jgi:hypothetical protein
MPPVLILLYMCPRTTIYIYVLVILYMCPHRAVYAFCPHTSTYVSSYMPPQTTKCVLILLHVSLYMPPVLILLHTCPRTVLCVCVRNSRNKKKCKKKSPHADTAIYRAPSYYYICVLILLYVSSHYYVSSYYYMCPHTTIYVSSYYYICVLILRLHTTYKQSGTVPR